MNFGQTRLPPISRGWNGISGTVEEERMKGALFYLDVLDRLHRELQPVHYLEIGVRHGGSLMLARGTATGVDPAPAIDRELPATTRVVAMTSDQFFGEAPAVAPDLCFIDGMHLVEFALRDFMNVEERVSPSAIIVLDDVFPNHPAQAKRERQTRVWTGDVWRIVPILRRYRSDLFLMTLDTAPAGLLLVAGLNPANRTLQDNYDRIVQEALAEPGPPVSVLNRDDATDPSGERFSRVMDAINTVRRIGLPSGEVVARLRAAEARS